ncbi:MAG TPA: restriction endonuclease [Magnetococcales bacterium]|nr:restriction endonuclease [Magnetococcales bacterium]
MTTHSVKKLIEIFGFSPEDHTSEARKFWDLKACPFIGRACTKFDHTNTICYGTCSVSNGGSNVVICPNRLYENDYATIRNVSTDVFGAKIPMIFFDEYVKIFGDTKEVIVALGQYSGKEVKLSQMSMDWVLAHIRSGELQEYVGIEVQSIDITGNYRDVWYAAKNQENVLPASAHGLNWANVHKRLIPQLIRKGLIYSRSALVRKGLYFVVPETVFRKFEEIIGNDIPKVNHAEKDVVSVFTYNLSQKPQHGQKRSVVLDRVLRFKMDEFAARFISGANLPPGRVLDDKIREVLTVK